MITRLDMSPEEIALLVAQAPEPVANLLLALLDLLAQQQQLLAEQAQTIEQQAKAIEQLTARVRELEDKNNRTSRNSHQPPAADGFKKQPRSLRSRSTKRPGGQPGHAGHTLTLSEQPDQLVLHRPSHCSCCGQALDQLPAHSSQRRQVIDLPPLALQTTEHQVVTIVCPACQQPNSGSFPPEVTEPVQYGPRLAALVVYLRTYQLLPSARTQQLLSDLFGSAPSEGTLDNMLHTAAERLRPVVEQIRQGLCAAAVAHFDETGCYVEDKRYWLHVACTASLTYYFVHRNRGQLGSKAAGVLPNFKGVAVHDAYAAYWEYECEHALCNAHLLRELLFLVERGQQEWAEQLAALLREMLAASNAAREAAAGQLDEAALAQWRQRYRELIATGLAQNPAAERPAGQVRGRVKQSAARNLLLRLQAREGEVLRFASDLRVPFENNQAERDLRMMKVQQKISGRFRTAQGAAEFCRIRSYISTMRKQAQHVFTALAQVFLGTPLSPAPQAE